MGQLVAPSCELPMPARRDFVEMSILLRLPPRFDAFVAFVVLIEQMQAQGIGKFGQ